MCFLMRKADGDIEVTELMLKENDEKYLDFACYHIEQAIEKILKALIEIRGERYSYSHNITLLYEQYRKLGYPENNLLELMAGTIDKWSTDSRYLESFKVTLNQCQTAKGIYAELRGVYVEELSKGDADLKHMDVY